jgi:ABC-type nitrate/sulfonate/bicarbonate transport system substrate-binding protein
MAVRADLGVKRGDMNAIKGLRISSSTAFPDLALKHQAGIDLERDKVEIVPSLTTGKNELWHGRDGVDAIKRGADAYWGNGMRAAIGEKLGVAKIHLDLRRGDGPPGARLYNFAALTTTDQLINEQPQVAAGAVRAIVKTQRALKADPSLATRVGTQLFPAEEASLIGDLVARDAPFYDVNISLEAVDGLNRFAKANGLISEPVPYDQLVAPPFIRQLWNETGG